MQVPLAMTKTTLMHTLHLLKSVIALMMTLCLMIAATVIAVQGVYSLVNALQMPALFAGVHIHQTLHLVMSARLNWA
jgi:hypothetical protein